MSGATNLLDCVGAHDPRLPGALTSAKPCPWGADCIECGDVLLCWLYGKGDAAGIHDGDATVCGGCGRVYSWSACGDDDSAHIANEGEPWGMLTAEAMALLEPPTNCEACPHNHPAHGYHLCRAPFNPATRAWSRANTDRRGKALPGAVGCPGFGVRS